jgi:hypothetical protein
LDLRRRKWWDTGEDCIMRNFITCIEIAETLACMRNAYKIIVLKPEGV